LVLLSKLSDFAQAIFDTPGEVIPMGLSRAQFVFMTVSDLCRSFREFCFETRPRSLVLTVVFALEQAECFLGGKLGDAGEVLNAETIQNLSALQFPRTATQRALDGVVQFAASTHVYVYGRLGYFVWFCGKSSVTRTLLSGRFFQNARIPRLEGLNLTIRQLIQQQRQRLCSTNPVERFAAALLISGELTKRLSKLNDCEIGELLDDEVGARLNILAPELTICLAAVDRLRQRANEHNPVPSKG
jgi:hypothetical protein